jgi:KaiC/GvpD/RAD55 family RecA-like ATPase
MSHSLFDSNAKDYEILLLANLLRDPKLFKTGLTKLNQVVRRGTKDFKNHDFIFPIHNVIWEKSVEMYLVSGQQLPTAEMLLLGLSSAMQEGLLNPMEFEPAIITVKRMYEMGLAPAGFILGTFPDYLKYVRTRQVEERKSQGAYENYEEYVQAYNDALRSSVITSVSEQMTEPFTDLSITDVERHRVPIGIGKLDEAFGGGVGLGELLIWIAVSGGGKTIALNQSAIHAAQWRNPVFLGTCELTPERMKRRLYSYATGIEYAQFKIGAKVSLEARKKLEQEAARIEGRLYIRNYVLEQCSIPLLDRDLDELMQTKDAEHRPRVVIIDYLDKIIPPRRLRDNPRVEYKEIVDELVRLAIKYNVAFHTATQSNQKGIGKSILDMNNASESYAKVFSADMIVGVSDIKDVNGLPVAKQKFHTAKNRDNAKTTIEVVRDFARQRFLSMEDYSNMLASRNMAPLDLTALPNTVPVATLPPPA